MADPNNPFSSFFSSSEAVAHQISAVEEQRCEIGKTLTRVFLCTAAAAGSSLRGDAEGRPRFVVSLPELAKDQSRLEKTGNLDLDILPQALAERLQMATPLTVSTHCKLGRSSGLFSKTHVTESSNLLYLAHCYTRACSEREEGSKIDADVHRHVVEECKKLIVEMCSPVLARQPTQPSFTDLLLSNVQSPGSVTVELFYRIAEFYADDPAKLQALFDPALMKAHGSCRGASLLSPASLFDCLPVLEMYSRHSILAQVLVSSSCWCPAPSPHRPGKLFETETIVGRLLSPTTVSPSNSQPSEHFPLEEDIMQNGAVESVTDTAQQELEPIISRMHKVFDSLLRLGPETRNAVIGWLVQCLEANRDRGKMLSRLQHVMGPHMMCASDGFFLNLGWVMLKLAAPFTRGDGPTFRLPSIDPLYCVAAANPRLHPHKHLLNFSKETRMAPTDSEDGEELSSHSESDPTFNFTTHCFFLAHKTLMLGMSQTAQRFSDTMTLYGRTYYMMQNLIAAGGRSGPLYRRIHSQFLLLHSQVHGFKAHMGHPQLQELCLTFQAATARWLVWLVTPESHDITTQSHDPNTLFPLPSKAPAKMWTVPECLVDNMAHFIDFLARSQSDVLRRETRPLSHLITFATVFMGSPQYVQNPHLRARIAQLVSLMIQSNATSPQKSLIPFSKEAERELFESHEVACAHLIRALMRIFVDIEHTGDSMEFEAKFQYRLPMYAVLRFVWELPAYGASVEVLTREAVEYDGSEQEIPSLLRFINMIINDATVQLDEGLENMILIGELQKEKQSEEWQSYTEEQKKELQQKLSEATQMAKNRNLLASETVEILRLITASVQAPFVLPTMVDRFTAMLNYVLKQLVGPKRRQLNVDDMDKYHFTPKKLVHAIVSIYVNLGQRSEFCQALPQDGRSFSLSLLEEAAAIMRTLGHGELMEKMYSLVERVRKYSEYLAMEDSALDDAPEEFLDPVTNELMKEPVRLPTSGVTMDKANVIRHLLSDATDPFNRSPLTADMLEPDQQLKQRIEEWRTQKLAHIKKTQL